jgi:hypothetical protein
MRRQELGDRELAEPIGRSDSTGVYDIADRLQQAHEPA